jgi:hypothetical protein
MNHSSDADDNTLILGATDELSDATGVGEARRVCVGRSGAALALLSIALLASACGGSGYVNPPPPPSAQHGAVQFASGSLSIDENAGTATVTITRTSGSDGAVSVTLASSDGSASAGQDYTTRHTTVSFEAGDVAAKTVAIEIMDDAQSEADESFSVTLSAATGGATLGTIATSADDP